MQNFKYRIGLSHYLLLVANETRLEAEQEIKLHCPPYFLPMVFHKLPEYVLCLRLKVKYPNENKNRKDKWS